MIKIILFVLFLFVGFIFFKEFKNYKKKALQRATDSFEKGDIEKTEKIYKNLIKKKSPDYIQAMDRLGRFYYYRKKYKKAKKVFEDLYELKLKKNNATSSAVNYLSLIANKQGDYDLAIEYIIRFEELGTGDFILKSNASSSSAFLILSRCYLKKGDIEKSETYLEKYFSMHAEQMEAGFKQQGENFLELAEYDKAKKCFEKINKKNLVKTEQSELSHLLSMALLGKKDYKNILEMDRNNSFLMDNKSSLFFSIYSTAIAYIKTGKFEEAKKKLNLCFELVVFMDLNNFYNFYNFSLLRHYSLGILNSYEKKYKEAEDCFKRNIEIIEKIPEIRYKYFMEKINIIFLKLLSLYELARINWSKKDPSKAKQYIFLAINLIEALKIEEKKIIELKEVGNEGSIIKKINNLNLEINEKT
ncbi:MAG: hypothetical protein PHF88_00030 [Candidatus Pacebacteria bacterium]|nr:hypothetical protein [Candidatus Paceibacterota bacterium]